MKIRGEYIFHIRGGDKFSIFFVKLFKEDSKQAFINEKPQGRYFQNIGGW